MKFVALNIDPALGIFAASRAELCAANVVFTAALAPKFFFDFPFNWQTVAVPARHVIRVMTQHLVAAVDDILVRLVQRRAHMDVTIGVGRSVVECPLTQRIFRRALFLIQANPLPALQPFRLGFGQACAHRKIGFGQEQRVAIIAGRISCICHGSLLG